MNNDTRKLIRNAALILLVTVLVSALLLGSDFHDVLSELKEIDLPHILLAVLLTMLWQFSIGLSLTIFSKIYRKEYTVKDGFLNALIAALFNNITPSSTGGQVVQFTVFRKQGLKSEETASVLWLEFLMFQIMMCLGGVLFYFLKLPMFLKEFSAYNIFFFLGLFLHVLLIGGIYLLLKSARFHALISEKGIGLLSKLHLLKEPKKTRKKIDDALTAFQSQLHHLKEHKKPFLYACFLCLFRLLFHYSISYAVLTGLGIPSSLDDLLTCVCLSNFINVSSALVPLPGGSGGAEALFVLLFGRIYDPVKARAGMLLWRFFSFYLLIVVGAIAYGYYKIKEK